MRMSKIRSSGTRSPRVVYSDSRSPRSVPRAISALSRSPDEICAIPVASDSCSQCVPLPAPGGDSMISRMTTHLPRELLCRGTSRAYHGSGGQTTASEYKYSFDPIRLLGMQDGDDRDLDDSARGRTKQRQQQIVRPAVTFRRSRDHQMRPPSACHALRAGLWKVDPLAGMVLFFCAYARHEISCRALAAALERRGRLTQARSA